MKRRTLDLAFSVGGALFAVLLLILGFVLKDQGSFAEDYVKGELSAQKITFTPAKFLSDSEKQVDCLVKYGTTDGDDTVGQPLDSGKKAECYGKYIKGHMEESAKEAGYEGATYSTMGDYVRPGNDKSLVDQLQAAKDEGDDAKAEELQAALDEAKGLRSTLQTGETLRGLLLTTYGFSIFGEKADLAATVCFIAFALLFVLSILGLLHAFFSKGAQKVIE